MSSPGRRHFLGQAGAAALALAAIPRSASAQPQPQGAAALKVVDFHNHYVGLHFAAVAGAGAPAAQQAYWQAVNRNLADPDALLASIETAGISARVINTPLEFLRNAGGELAPDTVPRINDGLAELVAKHPGRLYGLATVDAYAGEAAASELTRAVRELGLRGVFVEAAKGELFLDAPQAHPTLVAAAALGVPVFCHLITDPALLRRFRVLGRLGVALNRGTINAAALFSLLESGTFEERHVYVDTTGPAPDRHPQRRRAARPRPRRRRHRLAGLRRARHPRPTGSGAGGVWPRRGRPAADREWQCAKTTGKHIAGERILNSLDR
jgi:aminocarboxymuconate-semialdehyde decarboxylase